MKRWEAFNKYSDREESLVTQTLKVFVDKMAEHIGIDYDDDYYSASPRDDIYNFFEKVDCDGLFNGIREWLCEEVEDTWKL